jgi:hypothetical protein
MSISGNDSPTDQDNVHSFPKKSRRQGLKEAALWLSQTQGGEPAMWEDELASHEPLKTIPYNDGDLLVAGFVEIAQYNYTDLRHNQLYQVVRYEHPAIPHAKAFRYRRQDVDKKWAMGMSRAPAVPYRWPALAARPSEEVFYCEGEKSADLLSSRGLLATTSASQSWTRGIAEVFANKTVHVLVDADEKGEANAARAEEWLLGVDAAVRLVRLPGLRQSQDVCDWLIDRTTEELVTFARGSRPSLTDAPEAELPDPKTIPIRQWLYSSCYIRESVSVTAASDGVGKSTLVVGEVLAMASGRGLLGVSPNGCLRVWYWNGEDSLTELNRKVAAAMIRHGLSREDLGDRLRLSGREMPMALATDDGRGVRLNHQLIRRLTKIIRARAIDVLVIDPFISCHRVRENDNIAVDKVVKSLGDVAEETGCSIMIVHHTRKAAPGEKLTADHARGASALKAATRFARVLNAMTEEEAELAEVDEDERRSYFRSDKDKTSFAKSSERADWYKLESVDLGNTLGEFGDSDKVGVATAWFYPRTEKPMITKSTVIRAQDRIRAGGPWRENQQAKNEQWVGVPVALAIGWDLTSKAKKKVINELVQDWIGRGWLKKVIGQDYKREDRWYVEAGNPPAEEDVVRELPEGLEAGTGQGISSDLEDLPRRG